MRGTVIKRYKGSYAIILDLGYKVDAETGKKKRNHGTRQLHQAILTTALQVAVTERLVIGVSLGT
jgi:hypothetical protein